MGETSFSVLLDGAGFQAATVLVCLTGISYMLFRSKPEKIKSRILLWLLVNVLISAICSLLYALTKESAVRSESAFALAYATQYVYFLFHLTLAPSFCLYMLHLTGLNYDLDWRKYLIINIPAFVLIVMALLNPLTEWIFYFDSNRVYQRGNGIIIPYIIGTAYYIAGTVIVFIFWNLMTRRRKLVLIYLFLVTILGIFLQLVLSPVHTELFTEAVGLIGVMVNIGNEEDVTDQRLNIYNHVALNYDLNVFGRIKRSFCLIVIQIQNPMSLIRFGVTTGVGAVSALNAEYICSLVPKKYVYIASVGTFVIIHDNTDREFNFGLARTIKERFNHCWHYRDRDIKYAASVMCAEIPKDFDSVDDIMLLVNSQLPSSMTQQGDILYGDILRHIVSRCRMDSAIMRGLDNRKFEVYYQPIYRTKDLSICACEALTRLHDEEYGDIYPDEFLPYAEKSGVIFDIGDFVINEVCSFMSSGIPTEMGVESISVNLSIAQCMQPSYAERIAGITSKYPIDPKRITFEIKEAATVNDLDLLKRFIADMRNYGFSFSVDNYGIGYSNISTTFSLDIDVVKIDRSLLWEAESSSIGKIILESTLDMIRKLGKTVMLTGVEDQTQIEIAKEFGVQTLQGYYFSNPLSQNEFISILKATQMARYEEQKALAASEAMSNFLTSMSHEIRTPINAVLGMDEMILRECDDSRILEYARSIEGAGRTLLSLINDILDLSKLEAGKLEITETSYELSTLISDVLNMIRFKAEDKGLELKCEVDPSVPEKLLGDETRIRQILLNIMNNAVKYTDEGSVTLKAAYEKTGKDTIKLMFSVKDTGIGIKEEDKAKMFDKFRRLDTERNKSVEGSGLGLAITSQLIRNMNGAIDVESEYGNGTTFYVIIPQKVLSRTGVGEFREGSSPKQNERISDVERFHAPDAMVLIVDDTPMNIAVVKALLRRIEVKTDEASGGAECLEKVKKYAYDLILLDYRMPEMDGIEVLKKIRALENNPNRDIPVIALTANAIAGARERFLAEGFDDYITKPVDGLRLEKMLMVYLPADKIKLNANNDNEDIPDGRRKGAAGNGKNSGQNKDTGEDSVKSGVKTEDNGIDYDIGIANCGSEEIYRSILQIFTEDIDNKTDAIRQALSDNDIKRYTVEVHALKSSARTIGAMAVSELARELEEAGDREDIERINADTERLLEMFKGLRNAAEGFGSGENGISDTGSGKNEDDENGNAPDTRNEISREAWKDALETIREFAELMDYDDASMILSSLKDYDMPGEYRKQACELRGLVDGLKWERAVERIDMILSEM